MPPPDHGAPVGLSAGTFSPVRMAGLVETLAAGVLLGFSLAAPPGPMNALIAANTVHRGRGAGTLTGLGALSADAVLGFLVLGLGASRWLAPYRTELDLLGAGVLCLFAFKILRPRAAPAAPVGSMRSPYLLGLGLGISNPYQILWWLTAGLALVATGGAVLLLGLFGAIGVWIVSFPLGLHWISARRPRVQQSLTVGSGVLLLGFAALLVLLVLL